MSLTIENVLEVYEAVAETDVSLRLRRMALDFIFRNWEIITKSAAWEALSQQHKEEIEKKYANHSENALDSLLWIVSEEDRRLISDSIQAEVMNFLQEQLREVTIPDVVNENGIVSPPYVCTFNAVTSFSFQRSQCSTKSGISC